MISGSLKQLRLRFALMKVPRPLLFKRMLRSFFWSRPPSFAKEGNTPFLNYCPENEPYRAFVRCPLLKTSCDVLANLVSTT